MTHPRVLRFHSTPAEAPLSVRTAVRPVGRPTMTSSRCRRCGRWLTLEEDEIETIWEPSSPGVICWNCDQEELRRTPSRDTL